MKTNRLWLWAVVVMLTLPAMSVAGEAPKIGDQLIELRLDAPESAEQRTYLGLKQPGSFSYTSISGNLLIIEIFSMYCPHCQREAPAVNRLHQAIQTSEVLKGRVKMIGIGVGNSTFEVDHFRKHYKIDFPLFPDEDFVIHQALGEVRTPFFIIVALDSSDKGKVLWTGTGNMDPLDTFIDRLNGLLKDR
jgi:thiol-disulfide isomerase/thioredoxin